MDSLTHWSCAWCGLPVRKEEPAAMHPKCADVAEVK